ncbi:MAG: N-6 DNA methylase [Bacteroidetes bacterium]|nr:N-6 DNA methylase [Bacteroidota bacterium]
MTTKETAYNTVSALVERFEEQYSSYKNSDYNETLTRRDFIDPFFKALGWDIDNQQGFAEAYREVIHEDRVRVGDKLKAPDYSFRLSGGKRLFFVEAKKPSVVVKDEIVPAYQVRRYGWSAKLPVSIITDFEEFALYDCTTKPNPSDKASVARIKYLTFRDYLKEFDFLWDTFSKERVLKGSFDTFIKSDTHKKGTATVDKEFLQSLDNWRTYLATSISWNNKELDEDEINFVVQQTIDRIIFLRIAEDRRIEPYGNLKLSIKQGDFYKNLFDLFVSADEKYNSGLFDFKKDKLSKKLAVDNKVIKNIVNELYYPESPYEFSVLSVEILGSAYEQFLGKQIKIDKAHRARIEEKPEVRKAGGVYYTPQYIVEYIVKNTAGKLIEGKKPSEIEKIKILDPACGSGSFLIGAYQYLLDYHKDYYSSSRRLYKGKKDNPLTPEGNLTTSEKKKILLNNIFGVDIDVNAVEVTKLSLLLKCMEGETEASIANQMKLFHERVLPTLDSNIKSGNSLIDVNFYSGIINFGEDKKVRPFNWEKGFPEIFKSGGFDCVIGNPPYVNLVAIPQEQRSYLQTNYKTCKNKSDLYSFFIEKSCSLIKDEKSKFGFIVPHTWLATDSFELLRKKLLLEHRIESISEMGFKVFDGVTVSTVILICSFKNKNIQVRNKDFTKRFSIPTQKWIDDNFHIDLEWNPVKEGIYKKLELNTTPLEKILQFSRGIKTSNDERFIGETKKNKEFKPVFRGRNIKAYSLNWAGEYIWYRPDLMKEKVGCLPHSKEFFEVPEKLVTQRVNSSMQLLVAYDNQQNYFLDTTNVSRYESWDKLHSLKFIMAILNSKLINFWYCTKFKMPTIGLYELHSIPFRKIDFKNKNEVDLYSEIIKYVDQLMQLNIEKQKLNIDSKIIQLEGKIDFLKNKIDDIVYKLYRIDPNEIELIKDVIN